jgi:spore maturation protein SpmB
VTNSLKLAIVGAVVALASIAGAVTVALSLGHGLDSSTTPIVTTVLGVLGTTITALLALLAVVGVDRKVNGHIERLTAIAQQAAAQTGDPHLAAKAEESKAIADEATHGEVKP